MHVILYRFESKINSNTTGSSITLQQCETLIVSLKEKYPHEYKVNAKIVHIILYVLPVRTAYWLLCYNHHYSMYWSTALAFTHSVVGFGQNEENNQLKLWIQIHKQYGSGLKTMA